jgi:hypothetical protein
MMSREGREVGEAGSEGGKDAKFSAYPHVMVLLFIFDAWRRTKRHSYERHEYKRSQNLLLVV